MTTVPTTNSEADSKTGKSTDNFVGSSEQIQYNKQALKNAKTGNRHIAKCLTHLLWVIYQARYI